MIDIAPHGIAQHGTDSAPATARDRFDAMHHEIRQRICLLDYPPGMRLSEAALAEECGTSRTPIRRVLARLEDEGLVQSQHGVGTIVTDADIHTLAEVYRLRVELTQLAGHLDPAPPTAAFMERLAYFVDYSATTIPSSTPKDFTRFDMEVFQLLLQLTSNMPLRQTMERLYFQTKRIWLKSAMESQLNLQDEFRIFHHELEAVQQALRSEDLVAAAHIQRAHISMSFKRLQQNSV